MSSVINPVRNPYMPLDNEVWAQLRDTPEDFIHESFVSKEIEEGVRRVTGTIKATGETATAAYCFAAPLFDLTKAQAWLSKKNIQAAKLDEAKDRTYRQITAKAATFAGGRATVRAEAGQPLPRLEVLVYTGGKVQPEGWDAPIVVDLAGLEIPAEFTPVLKDHDPDLAVGHGTARSDGRQVTLSGVVSCVGEAAQEVLAAAANGFPWKSSIGCDRTGAAEVVPAGMSKRVNGQDLEGPFYYWPTSVLQEVTITGRGADPNTRVSIAAKAASKKSTRVPPAAKSAAKKTLRAASPPRSPRMDEQFKEWCKSVGADPDSLDAPENADKKANLSAAYSALCSATKGDEGGDEEMKKAAAKARKAELRAEYAAETKRLDAITKCHRDACAAWGMETKEHGDMRLKLDELRAKAASNEWSAEKIELEYLRLGRPAGVISNTRVNAADLNSKVLEAAACRALMMEDKKLEKHFDAPTLEASARREFKNIGLKSLMCQAASARGWSGRWINDESDVRDVLYYAFPDKRTLRAEASTFQLPGILSNLVNKYLYEGFYAISDAWSRIAAKRPAADFKPVPGFRFFGNMKFEKIGKDGEIPHGDVGELAYVNAVETYAKAINTSRQDIINDDLSALSRIPQLIGLGAAYALNHVFWNVFLTGKDAYGNTIFSSGNGNYLSGASSALSVAALTTAYQNFLEQKKPDGEPLGYEPAVLLVPPALRGLSKQIYTATEMRQIVTALGSTSAAATKEVQIANIYEGEFDPVVCPYIGSALAPDGTTGSDTAWYLFTDPAKLALMEVVFLNGQQTPTVQSSEADFDVLGLRHRGFFDFGVKAMEYRAALQSAGA